jgi:DNA polymerase
LSSDATPRDPRREYAALLRAAAARIELERSFGIESWKLPDLSPTPADSDIPKARKTMPPQQSKRPARQRPAAPPPKKPPEPVLHVTTESSVDLFQSKDYDVQIPEGLSKQEQLDHFASAMADCTLCPLHKGRTQIVFGVGNPDADLMFIGEAPGRDEDEQGIPFVGRAGQLLTKIIEAMGFTRDEVYIANINKCRPPSNRAPMPDEMARCAPFLLRQIDIIQPKVICLLGATAVRGLLKLKEGITKLRGRFIQWRDMLVMPTYHPAYLLRNPAGKRDVWEDVQRVRDAVRGA